MKISNLFRIKRFKVGKKETEHLKHFLNNFGIDIKNLISISTRGATKGSMELVIEELYEPK